MTTAVPDEELMAMVRDGAADMLGVLFDRYQTPLFNFYSRLTGDRGASEDLVQEVFVRVLKYRRTYRPGTRFRPWIYQIARNARTDHMSKQRSHSELDDEMATSSAQPNTAQRDTVERDQQHAILHRALLQLPEEKREVLLLSRFQGLRYEEIAELLGCQAGAVKVRVHRALQELREVFIRLESGGASVNRRAAGANHEM
jgi:RNA polymerase sigma factor (sigma-70 family)